MNNQVQDNMVPSRIVVTGGGSGIGLGIRQRLLDAGNVVCSADPTHAEGLRQVGEKNYEIQLDVSDSAAVDRVAGLIGHKLGGVDSLVNNAGIGGVKKAVSELTDDEWRSVFAVNVDGPFFLVRAFLSLIEQSENPSILSVSTASTRMGIPQRSPYVASKMALVGLNRALTRELGPKGIRCNTIHPGAIENERGDYLMRLRAEKRGVSFDEAMAYRLGFISMRTRIRPEEIGDLVVFLTSNKARNITGQEIFIDGNMEWED